MAEQQKATSMQVARLAGVSQSVVSRAFTPVIEEEWDVAGFDISEDGSFIAYEVNAAGRSQMKIYNVASGETRSERARTGAPMSAITAATPTVRSRVLFPDMFDPLTM